MLRQVSGLVGEVVRALGELVGAAVARPVGEQPSQLVDLLCIEVLPAELLVGQVIESLGRQCDVEDTEPGVTLEGHLQGVACAGSG